MEITIFTVLIWVVAIIIGSLDFVIYLGSKQISSRAFFLSIFWVFVWITSVGFFVSTNDLWLANIFAKLTYYLGSMIATSFLYFFFTFPNDNKPVKIFPIILIIMQAIFAYLFLFTDTVINNVFITNSPSKWGWHFGNLSFIFELSFIGFFTYGIYTLYKKYINQTDLYTKKNLKFMLITIIIGALPPSVMCIILPRLNYFDLNWLGPITEIVWIPIISYSIFKYRQMNVKAVIAEVLAISMTTIFFINIFTNVSENILLRISTFLIFITLAIYLIRVSLNESKQKDLLRVLNDTLEQKVAEQTQEIKKSWELEKKARRELEKLNETKDQFIMITQHHLRSPVTSIQSELKALTNITGDKISSEIKDHLDTVKSSTIRLARIVDDFLNITTLKVGSKILTLNDSSIKPLIDDIISELKIDIENMHLNIIYPDDLTRWPMLHIDINKIREALLIIIENAVRYNIPNGSITIETSTKYDLFEIIIENTGVGITHEEKNKLFTKLFYRSNRAKLANPIGMGIGLSVARAIARAHHGDLIISSDGENKGAKAIITIPLDFIKQINLAT